MKVHDVTNTITQSIHQNSTLPHKSKQQGKQVIFQDMHASVFGKTGVEVGDPHQFLLGSLLQSHGDSEVLE